MVCEWVGGSCQQQGQWVLFLIKLVTLSWLWIGCLLGRLITVNGHTCVYVDYMYIAAQKKIPVY